MGYALLNKENITQQFLDIVRVIIVAIDASRKVTLINRKGCEVLGYNTDEITGKNWFDNFLPENIRDEVKTVFARIMAGEIEPVEYFENPVLTKSGEERIIEWHNTLLKDEAGNIIVTLSSGEDITERKKAEEGIKSLAKFPDENPNPVIRIAAEGTVLYANESSLSLLEAWNCRTGQLSPAHVRDLASDTLKSGLVRELEVTCGDIIYSLLFTPITDSGYVNIYGRNITERKLAENDLKLAYNLLTENQDASLNIMEDLDMERKRLDAALKEREVLLREIHHRVKNNMQVILSLLNMQARFVKEKWYVEMLNDIQNRLKAMSLVHEKLYRSSDLAHIDFNDYMKSFLDELLQSYSIARDKIGIKTGLEGAFLDIGSAITLGLIINELVTNSVKYAFPGDRKGEIRIVLHRVSDNMMELVVSDNGISLPEGMDFRKTESLGLQLVNLLVEKQLKGSIELNMTGGTEFRIKFGR